MKFQPKSDQDFAKEEQERKEAYLWPAGIYDYEVLTAVDKESKKGNPMTELLVKLFKEDGKEQKVSDYIGDWNLFKLKHICEANGKLDLYEAGNVEDHELYGATGKCRVGVQKGSQKDDGSFYPDKNVIQDYLKPVGKPQTKKHDEDVFKDSVPF